MTPGTFNIPIYKGAKWEHTLTFKQGKTNAPVDLTGLGPFVMQFKDASGNTLAFATIDIPTPANGQMGVTLTAAQTDDFPLGNAAVFVGLRDDNDNPYLQATLPVKTFTPDPA